MNKTFCSQSPFHTKRKHFKLRVNILSSWSRNLVDVKVRKNGQQCHATCFATLLQNELDSDLKRFTTHIKPVLHQIRLLTALNVGKTRNIVIQLVLQQCYKTSCTFSVACFTEVSRPVYMEVGDPT